MIKLITEQRNNRKWYAAICASPAIVFEPHGLMEGEKATCHPSLQHVLKDKFSNKRVVLSNSCHMWLLYVVTSQGPATAIVLGLTLIKLPIDKEKADVLAKALVVNNYL